ncbi:Amino Acid Transporter [Trichostrongylus colubriformis]|uniref:Amino Acid Transporter n=1 Tax=Trichostrongylus colubriformis TaxID=6319 RepID=A0AAN8IDH1_TRICO
MDDKHKLGFLGATSYVIGNIIGSGIFITPASILRCTDSVGLSLVIWLLCAVIAILGALVYIELGTSIREAGCDFAYICYVKWYSIAFAFMFVSVLMTYPATIAIISETFGQYLVEGLKQVYDIDDDWAPLAQKLFGFSLLLMVTWMNFFSLSKFAGRFQIIATAAKLLSCFLIIATGAYFYYFKGWKSNLRDPMKGSNYKPGDLILGFYGGLWAFSGWDVLNYSTGEIARPRRNVPLALLVGILTVTAIYVSINVAYFVALDVDTVKSSNAVAALFSQATLGSFANLIPFLIGVLLVGSLNSNLFSGSRYMYAAARQGHLPTCFSCVNIATESPRVAVMAQTLLAIGISFVGDLDALINYVMFGFWAQRIFTLVALLIIRHNRIPVHPEAVRMPLWCIYTFLTITVALVVIPIFQEFSVTSLAIGICLIGFALYFLFVYPTILPTWLYILNERSTFICSVVFDCLPDVKPGVAVAPLVSSDSSQALLAKRPSIVRLSEEDSLPDLHSDEKNVLRRNGSSAGFKLLFLDGVFEPILLEPIL